MELPFAWSRKQAVFQVTYVDRAKGKQALHIQCLRQDMPRRSGLLLGGAALVYLATSLFTNSTQAANYTVSNESELISAISAANASGDPSSTITLSNNITILDPASLGAATVPITIKTGIYALTGTNGTGITEPGGAALNLGGSVTIVGDVTGGNAADSDSAGIGGVAVVHNGGKVTNIGTIVGGRGGNANRWSPAGRASGGGGVGMLATNSIVINASGATIKGGDAGSYDPLNSQSGSTNSYTGGGGTGLVISDGSLENGGVIEGGTGGIAINVSVGMDNLFAGTGGAGAIISGGTHANFGIIKGGGGAPG